MAANGSARGASLFKDEELRDMSGIVKGEAFVEVTCGSTSQKYGDYVGRLKIFETGDLEIKCDCIRGCDEGILTPSEFEKHARGKAAAKNWKINIWVIVRGRKVALSRTSLLKYYVRAEKTSGSFKGHRPIHRDEFICCTRCKKERRFRRLAKEECRNYHDAMTNTLWECSDFPLGKISCDDEEERASRKVLRGCPLKPLCKGCARCYCTGCELCCFSDCNCRECVDFEMKSRRVGSCKFCRRCDISRYKCHTDQIQMRRL